MNIKIVTEKITRAEAKEIGKDFYKEMVKGVVDIERSIVALGGEYHIDANMALIGYGSEQKNIWGFNFYPDESLIQYTSLINIRPLQNNRVIEIQDENLRKKIEKIIRKIIV